MTVVTARSQGSMARALIEGGERTGRHLGHGYVDVDGYVLAINDRGGPQMPNGIDIGEPLRFGEGILIGGGTLRVGDTVVLPGIDRGPPQMPGVQLRALPVISLEPERFAGNGPGLTPAGDDLLIGYVAGLVRYHDTVAAAATEIVLDALPRTTALSRTLLTHALRGELPEPAETFLQTGRVGPLLSFGATSGPAMAIGIALGCGAPERPVTWACLVTLGAWFGDDPPIPGEFLIEVS